MNVFVLIYQKWGQAVMSDWSTKTLGSICLKIGSGATPTGGKESYIDKGISLIRSQNVEDFVFLYDGLAYIDEEQARKLNNVTLECNDTLINITGDSVARVCSVPDAVLPARVNQHVAIVRADGVQLHNSFAKYSLLAMKEHLLAISEIGATRRALTKGMLESLKIGLPDIIEQQSISDVLSSLDDKIDLLFRQNATLEALAQAHFRNWFETHIGKQRIVGDFLESTLGGEWGKDNASDTHPMPVYCIRGTDVAMLISGLATKIPLRYIKPSKYERIALTNRDLIFEISGGTDTQSTGRATYINDSVKALFDLPIVFSNFCRCLRFKKEEFVFPFYLYIKGKWENDEFFNLENGSSGIHNLDYKSFLYSAEYADEFPSNEDFTEFSDFVAPLFEKIDKNKQQIVILQKLRDTLLPKLISGEVRVKQ